MARELASGTGVDQTPGRYAEQRAPQFTGGEVDATSGNIVPSTRDQIANTNQVQPAPPAPATPTTGLASISAAPAIPSSGGGSGLGSALGSAAINIGGSVLGKTIGNAFGSGDSNKGGPNAGGFSTGGGSGGGTPNTPFNLNPAGAATGPTDATAGLDNTTLNGGSSMASAAAPAAPSGTWAPDYSRAPLGTYTDTGYVTKTGLVPYASEQQKNNFESGAFAGYSRYDAPNVFTPSDPSGGSSFDGSAAPETSAAFPAESVPSAPAPSGWGGSGDDFWGGFEP